MTTEKQAGMPDVIWIGDIEGSHCRCWNGPTYGGFRGEGHISEPYIRRAIVTPEAAKRALDAVNHCIKTIHNESIRKEDNAIWSSGTACRPRITEDILETIRALLIAHGGGEC